MPSLESLPEPTWMPLASLRGLLGALGIVLEASWELLGRSWRRIRGILHALLAVFRPSWEPKGSPKGAQEAPTSSSRDDSFFDASYIENYVQ